jgi:hypothetical protein
MRWTADATYVWTEQDGLVYVNAVLGCVDAHASVATSAGATMPGKPLGRWRTRSCVDSERSQS